MIDEFSYSTLIRHHLAFNSAIYSCKKYITHPCKQLTVLRYFFLSYVLKSNDLYYHFTPSDIKYAVSNLVESGLLVKVELNRVNYKITNKGRDAIECFDRAYQKKFHKLQFRANPIPLQE